VSQTGHIVRVNLTEPCPYWQRTSQRNGRS